MSADGVTRPDDDRYLNKAGPVEPDPDSDPYGPVRGADTTAWPELAWNDPGSREGLCSEPSERSTFVEFLNRSDERIRVYWIDFHGELIHYTDVAPGRAYVQQTYVGHPWIVRARNGTELALFHPAAEWSRAWVMSKR